MGEPVGPYSTEDWQSQRNTLEQAIAQNHNYVRFESIVSELTDYCNKFTIPLPVKELRKVLGIL